MGILTRLRNAFGRSRKGRTAEAEGAEQVPAQEQVPPAAEQPKAQAEVPAPADEPAPDPAATPHVPDPRPAPREERDEEHELVAAAFDKVAFPKQLTEPGQPSEPGHRPDPEQPSATEPAAAPDPEPEQVSQPEQPSAPEPDPEATREPALPPEPVADSEQAAEQGQGEPQEQPQAPEPERASAPAPEPEPTPEPAAAAPEPEPEAAPAPAPAEPATTPEAADGDKAPQGSPAHDHEGSTGGAGGNAPAAEGEAAAEQPTPAQKPATPLTRVKSRAPLLTAAYKAATPALKKNDLTGARAKTYLVLDRSASMRAYYKDGSAQSLAEQTLALAAHLDPEATVHVTFFSTEVDGTTTLTLADHENKIDEVHAGLGRMGRTTYHAAIEEVLAHHDAHHPTTPALVVFQTDGAPDAKTPATQALTDAAKTHPHVFFSFVAFGEHDNKAFDYLRRLKTGNTSFFHAGPTPRELTDKELYEGVLATWRP
ncbi:VWA domain-containing protein [Streptomyces sp. NPDC093260]|uniref:VWA domain-containing protein n=1 Tax=Streptomyces sp. NPDC093260 TaxID=3155073 RepID=UPI003447AE05